MRIVRAAGEAPDSAPSLPEPQPVTGSDGQPTPFPNAPGIYAVFDAEGSLQYVGMSRKVCYKTSHMALSVHNYNCLGSVYACPLNCCMPATHILMRHRQFSCCTMQVAVSVANHQQDLPDRVHAVAVLPVQDASREGLTAAWTQVVQEQGAGQGNVRS